MNMLMQLTPHNGERWEYRKEVWINSASICGIRQFREYTEIHIPNTSYDVKESAKEIISRLEDINSRRGDNGNCRTKTETDTA